MPRHTSLAGPEAADTGTADPASAAPEAAETPETPEASEASEASEAADHEATDPEAVFRRSLRFLLAKDIDGWVSLWREDGVIDFPLAAEGAPRRLEGRSRIAAYMRDYPDLLDVLAFTDVTVHRTQAPETIVVEMRGEGVVVATSEPYTMRYICVVTVREGRIIHCRDYWSPQAAPTTLTVPDLTAAEASR